MPKRNRDDAQGAQGKARLSYEYGQCPKCELLLPLVPDCDDDDPVMGIRSVYSGAPGCGLCAMAVIDSEQRPLDSPRDCPDCGFAVRAPTGAAVIACPSCGTYFLNPTSPPGVQERVKARLEDRARRAEMLDQLARRLFGEQIFADLERWEQSLLWDASYPDCARHTDGLYGEAGPCVLPLGHRGPCSMYHGESDREYGPVRVPEEWIDRSRPPHEVFVEALITALHGAAWPREQRVFTLRYGLDGKPGRTFRQIAEDLGRSPSRARDLLWQGVSRVRLMPFRGDPQPDWPAELRACGVVAHLAADVLGDGVDPEVPARVRAFVDHAFPNARPQVAAKLLIELACLDFDVLLGGRDRALCRAVAAARPPGQR